MKKKIIFIVILIILILLVSIFGMRLSKLNKISELRDESKKISNLYFTEEGSSSITEFWKKDNIIKQNVRLKSGDGNITFWKDFEKDEGYTIFNNSKTYNVGVEVISTQPQANNINCLDNKNILLLSINPMFKITSKKYNDRDCYYIKSGQDEVYIDKEYGITLYQKNELNEYKVNYSVNTVTDEDIAKPDLADFTNSYAE